MCGLSSIAEEAPEPRADSWKLTAAHEHQLFLYRTEVSILANLVAEQPPLQSVASRDREEHTSSQADLAGVEPNTRRMCYDYYWSDDDEGSESEIC